MHPLFWFLSGTASALTVVLIALATRRRKPIVSAEVEPEPEAEPSVERELLDGLVEDTNQHLELIARGVGGQLADLASGVEGSAQQLCESIGDPRNIAIYAELLWGNVRQLRLFSEKLISFSSLATDPQPTDIPAFLTELRHDLEAFAASGIKVELTTSGYLPKALVTARDLRYALLFLVDTMLAMESNTSHLSLRAHTDLTEIPGEETRIAVELCASAEPSDKQRAPIQQDVRLGYLAARNLLEAQEASFSIEHVEGISVSCFVNLLPASIEESDEAITEIPTPIEVEGPSQPVETHEYGGILLLENDRSIRQMLSLELEQTGRNIFLCTDGASARSLVEATPERFELLILDHNAPIEAGDKLATDVLERHEGIKVLLLTARTAPSHQLGASSGGRFVELCKPFGILEFRDALCRLIQTETRAADKYTPDRSSQI